MAIVISGSGIDMGGNPVSNASQIDSVVMNENGDNVATTSNLVGFKNYIINGGFDVWQRGTSFSTATYGAYTADRWYNQSPNGTTLNAAMSGIIGNRKLLFNVSTPDFISNAGITTIIENGANILAGKTITVSFNVRNQTTSGTVNIVIGSFSSSTVGASHTQNIIKNVTTSTQRVSHTFILPSSMANAHLGVTISPSTTHTYEISAVQLEEGSVATPFENRPYGLELSLCQRYYQKTFVSARSYATAASQIINTNLYLQVTMRTTPTFTLVDGGARYNYDSAILIANAGNSNSYRFELTSWGAGGFYALFDIVTFSAEL